MSSRKRALLTLLLCTGLGALHVARASAQEESAEERKRRELRESLGIKEKKNPPKSDGDEQPESEGSQTSKEESEEKQDDQTKHAANVHVTNYVDDMRRMLQIKCASCHKAGGSAAGTKLHFTGRAFTDYKAVLPFINRSNPAKSSLLTKSEGLAHMGGKPLPKGSAGHAALLRWIKAGAPYKQPEATGEAGDKTRAQATPAARKSPPRTRPPKRRAPKTAPPKAADAEPQSWGEVSKQAPSDKPTQPQPTQPRPAAQARTKEAEAKAPAAPTATPFSPEVHRLLTNACGSCHAEGQFAGGTSYLVPSDPHAHFVAARSLVTPGNASKSKLYTRALGSEHAAGAIFTEDSEEAKLIAKWIDEGAHELVQAGAAGSDDANTPPATSSQSDNSAEVAQRANSDHPPQQSKPAHGASPHGSSPHAAGHGGLSLMSHPILGTLTLNGRFDLNYERRNYNDNPFSSDANDVLRSYHHFVFLTRQSEQDPVTIKLEMLTLQFWEISMDLSPTDWPVQVSTTLGKILVPFGAEPLFHQTYGGLAGFDQRVMPTVFAREGIKLDAQTEWQDFTFAADLYAIAGYQLRQPDGELNLQSDFAPLEEVRLGFGLRLGAAYGPISAWYSAYLNKLGFGRQLFMQALDVALWRPRGIEVLEHFSLGAGFVRADVSGGEDEGYGGPNADYYHFASYFQLRFYPVAWLYLQYRQGLRTFTNRRGFYIDETDLTAADASTHNIGISARYRGLSVGLFHFWNLEKTDEVLDDFTRLVVAYDF